METTLKLKLGFANDSISACSGWSFWMMIKSMELHVPPVLKIWMSDILSNIACSPFAKTDIHRQISDIKRSLLCNKIDHHSDVVGASPVGAAQASKLVRKFCYCLTGKFIQSLSK